MDQDLSRCLQSEGCAEVGVTSKGPEFLFDVEIVSPEAQQGVEKALFRVVPYFNFSSLSKGHTFGAADG